MSALRLCAAKLNEILRDSMYVGDHARPFTGYPGRL